MLRHSPAVLSLFMIGSCGGGGGSSPSPSPPMITAAPAPLAVTTSANSTAPSATVNVTFDNAPSTVYFSSSDFTTHGIASISAPTYNATRGSFTVTFLAPNGLKPATYTDTVTLLLCSDPQCKVVIATNPLTVNYIVTAPSGASSPQVTLDSTSLTYQALYVDASVVPVTLDPTALTFTNFAVTPYVMLSAPTTGGINAMNFTMGDATHGGITFTFAAANSLAQQTYTTPVNVLVCLDPKCVNPVVGANFMLTVQYVVENSITVLGANGYTMSIYPVPAVYISGNAHQNTIFASIAATAINNANSVVAIDATNGLSLRPPLASSAPPNALALSDDGQFLYVAIGSSVEQVATSTFTVAQTITKSVAPASPIQSIAVEPGQPQSIAVGGPTAGGPHDTFLQIFDGTVARSNSILGDNYEVYDLQWTGSPPALYGLTNIVGDVYPDACIYPVDGLGVTAAQSCHQNYVAGGRMDFGTNGLGYAMGNSEGVVWDPNTWTMVQTWPLPNMTYLASFLPDVSLNKLFAFAANDPAAGCSMQSFNLSSLAAISRARLPMVFNACNYPNPMVRWGTNGIAIMTSVSGPTGYIIVINGAFVGP
jgi:hypothetical protein